MYIFCRFRYFTFSVYEKECIVPRLGVSILAKVVLPLSDIYIISGTAAALPATTSTYTYKQVVFVRCWEFSGFRGLYIIII